MLRLASDILNTTSIQPPSNWNLDSGYSNNRSERAYPHHVFGTGLQASLIVILQVFKGDIDHLCGGGIQGFTVMFHPPNEAPQVFKKYFHLSPGKTISLSIEPKMTTTPDNIRTSYDPSVRRCYFEYERKLRFYKQYTQQNCEWECLSNYTLKQCGCVKYSMPRKMTLTELKMTPFEGFFFGFSNIRTYFQGQMASKFVDQPKLNALTMQAVLCFEMNRATVCRLVHHFHTVRIHHKPITILSVLYLHQLSYRTPNQKSISI